MLMTAAGTIAPARVLVLGAGVAGLQAIGTARRLGAVVEAFDVRKAVEGAGREPRARSSSRSRPRTPRTAGGYARELSEDRSAAGRGDRASTSPRPTSCIMTALIPGRRAPVLVTADDGRVDEAGSVIVDLAAEQQGNCELTQPGETVVEHGVTIIGATDLASRMCAHASQMYSRNMEKLLLHITKDGAWKLDFKDEIVAGPRHHPRGARSCTRSCGSSMRTPGGPVGGGEPMTSEWVFNLYVFVLATFVGYQVISRVPPLLHTPLMSGTNAISGISLVASLAGGRLGPPLEPDPRLRRGHLRHDQRGRRLPHHRPDARDVPQRRPPAPPRREPAER